MSDFSTAFAETDYFITVQMKLLVKMILLNATDAIFIPHFINRGFYTTAFIEFIKQAEEETFIHVLGLLSMLSLFRSKFNKRDVLLPRSFVKSYYQTVFFKSFS